MTRVSPPPEIICDCGCDGTVTDTERLVTLVVADLTLDFADWSHVVVFATRKAAV